MRPSSARLSSQDSTRTVGAAAESGRGSRGTSKRSDVRGLGRSKEGPGSSPSDAPGTLVGFFKRVVVSSVGAKRIGGGTDKLCGLIRGTVTGGAFSNGFTSIDGGTKTGGAIAAGGAILKGFAGADMPGGIEIRAGSDAFGSTTPSCFLSDEFSLFVRSSRAHRSANWSCS